MVQTCHARKGGSEAFKSIGAARPWRPLNTTVKGEQKMDSQSFVDGQQTFWEEVWDSKEGIDDVELDFPAWGQEAIIRLGVDEIRRAANQFKWFTGTSADAFRPQACGIPIRCGT